MFGADALIYDYRGELIENVHMGYICAVNRSNQVVLQAGDAGRRIFYRSASKPIQALPVFARALHEKYGLSEEECVIFAASHAAEPFHVRALESIMRKAGLEECDLIMKACYPGDEAHRLHLQGQGSAPRKLYHNCSGKHLACMLLQRELGGDVRDYWRPSSLAQQEILRVISLFSETPVSDVALGVDGCGVPVFAVAVRNFALSYRNLVDPGTVGDGDLAGAARFLVPLIHRHPLYMRGTGLLCSRINEDPNLIGKGGAEGAYGCALKSQGIGIAFKLQDGSEKAWPFLLREIMHRLGHDNAATDGMFEELCGEMIKNDNQDVVGRRVIAF